MKGVAKTFEHANIVKMAKNSQKSAIFCTVSNLRSICCQGAR